MNEIQNGSLRHGCGTGAETGAVLGQGFAAVSRQGGVVRQLNQDRGVVVKAWAVVGYYEMRTARARMVAPVSTGSPLHREHVLVPKSHRM